MDTKEKEAQLAAYEATLTGGKIAQPIPAVSAHVEKVAALSGEDEETICSILHALYAYSKRVGRSSIEKIGQFMWRHTIELDQEASSATNQSLMVAGIEQRN